MKSSLIKKQTTRSPLQTAARYHMLSALEYLFHIGADVNHLSGKTGYALHAASRFESGEGLAVLKSLLDHGADPNARGGKYRTALQAAAKHGCLDNVKLCFRLGRILPSRGVGTAAR